MAVKKLLSLKDVPAIFYAIKAGRKTCVLSDADLRRRSIACGCPSYLLSTEITILLHYTMDFHQRMFLATLINTGIDIHTAGMLTPSHFVLGTRYPYLHYFSSGKGHNREVEDGNKLAQEEYIVPLVNEDYVMQLRQLIYVHTLNDTAKENRPLWGINSITANDWISNVVKRAQKDGIQFCFDITNDTLRRSFAVRMLTLGIHPGILKCMIYFE